MPTRTPARTVSAALAATLLGAFGVAAQSPRKPAPVTGWQPVRIVDDDARIPAAARNDVRRQLEAILALLKKTRIGQSPQVEIRPEIRVEWEEKAAYTGKLTLHVYPATPNQVDQKGQPRRAIENALEVTVNDLNVLCSQGCAEAFLEPQKGTPVGDASVYQVAGGQSAPVLIVTPRTAPLYIPASQEEMVRARLRELQQPIDKWDGEARARRSQPSKLEAWLRERPQRRKEQEAAVAAMKAAGQSPAEIAEARADFDKTEKETEAMLRSLQKEEPALRAFEDKSLAEARTKTIAPIERRLAAMSAVDLGAPAYGGCGKPDAITNLCKAGEAGARRYVKLNAAFFETTLPRSALQVIGVQWWSPPNPDSPSGRFVAGLWDTTDWKRVQAALR